MKENEVPEKIFIRSEAIFKALNKRRKESDIEYTRTDALIEKALKWIDASFHEASIDGGFGGESVDVVMSEVSVYKDDLIKNFINYMKEE